MTKIIWNVFEMMDSRLPFATAAVWEAASNHQKMDKSGNIIENIEYIAARHRQRDFPRSA